MADDPVLDANVKLQAMKTLGHMVASTASWVRAPSQVNRLMGAFNRIAKSMKVDPCWHDLLELAPGARLFWRSRCDGGAR